jgi:sulfonate transport system substrate-binding protein
MNSKSKRVIIISSVVLIAIAIIVVGFFSLSKQPLFTLSNDTNVPIQIGWMNSFAESAIPAVTLKNTNFVKDNGLNLKYTAFQYGPPLVEASIAGNIDVLFTGIMPALSLLSKSDDWVIVGRLGYFQNALLIRSDLNINSISDLKGKKIALPVGTGPHAPGMKLLLDNNLDPKKDLTILNIKPTDFGVAFASKQIDAAAWCEPLITLFKKQNIAYPLTRFNDIAVIVVRKSLVENKPEEVKKFVDALKESLYYFSQNRDEIFKLASKETAFDYTLIQEINLVEPNYFVKTKDEISLDLSNDWINIMQEKADFEYKEGFFSKLVDVNSNINLKFIN